MTVSFKERKQLETVLGKERLQGDLWKKEWNKQRADRL